MFSRLLSLVTVLLAAACLWLPMPAGLIEQGYSLSLYPLIQRGVTSVTNLSPFAVLDVLLIVTAVLVGWSTAHMIRTGRRKRSIRPVVRWVWTWLTVAAALYLVFLALWGLNYRRVRMTDRVELTSARPDRVAVLALARTAVGQINQLHADAHRSGWDRNEWQDSELRVAFATTQRILTDARPAVPGRIKATLLGPYFRWSSVDGMVNPFGLEVLANPDLMPWERPFVAAHEWSHLAGYADESEANFVGWLTCIRADAPAQYSGWLFLYWQILGELGSEDRRVIGEQVGQGPRQDLEAIADRLRRGQLPFLRDISWNVYDRYLKANKVEEGVRSYSEVLSLILRTRFEEGWTPVRRGGNHPVAR